MGKLLRANFVRLRKSNSFLLGIIIQAFFAAIDFFVSHFLYGKEALAFGRSFIVGSYIMILLSVFITSFICTDYSCKTIRNKLIIGHSRIAIYFSNFITVLTGSLALAISYWVTVLVVALPLGGEIGMPPREFCFVVFNQLAVVTALVSFYVLLSELITSKSVAVTAALILSFILSVIGEIYMASGARALSVFFSEVIPFGQMVHMEMMSDNPIPHIFPVYSLIMIVISSAVGVIFFGRKDLK